MLGRSPGAGVHPPSLNAAVAKDAMGYHFIHTLYLITLVLMVITIISFIKTILKCFVFKNTTKSYYKGQYSMPGSD